MAGVQLHGTLSSSDGTAYRGSGPPYRLLNSGQKRIIASCCGWSADDLNVDSEERAECVFHLRHPNTGKNKWTSARSWILHGCEGWGFSEFLVGHSR